MKELLIGMGIGFMIGAVTCKTCKPFSQTVEKGVEKGKEIVDRKLNELKELTEGKTIPIWQKLSDLEREIVVRYVNMKRLLDMQIDELDSKIQANGSSRPVEVIELEKIVSENVEKIYSRLNESSTMFYEELSKIYKDLNENLRKKSEEDRYFFEQKLSELKSEFDAKLQNLKNEIVG